MKKHTEALQTWWDKDRELDSEEQVLWTCFSLFMAGAGFLTAIAFFINIWFIIAALTSCVAAAWFNQAAYNKSQAKVAAATAARAEVSYLTTTTDENTEDHS